MVASFSVSGLGSPYAFHALDKAISITLVVPVLLGLLLIVVGNYLPKNRQNYTIGLKLPWTLDDPDNWNKTHRLAGYLYILAGLVLIGGAFLSRGLSEGFWVHANRLSSDCTCPYPAFLPPLAL